MGTAPTETSNIMPLIGLMAKRLKEDFGAKEVILFGSYAQGAAQEDSDIDLLIIAEKKEHFFQRTAAALKLLRGIIRYIPLSPIVLTPGELEAQLKRHNQFVEEILETGIRI